MTNIKHAACVVVQRGHKFLGVTRKGNPEDCGLPGGKLEPGELAIDAAVRELHEETGLLLEHSDLVPLCGADDGSGYHTHTFLCTRDVPEDSVSPMEPGILVYWATADDLLNGSFGKYNGEVIVELIKRLVINHENH